MYDYVCVVQEGRTSLVLAIQNKHIEIVESLLNMNADPNITKNVSNE
jgi:ankyrin repeat protein